MRICYVADGSYIHTHRWIRFFHRLGHQVSLISFQPMDASHVEAVEREGGKYLGELGAFHVKRFWRTSRSLAWLTRVLRSEQIDVLHCHFIGANTWYAALSGFHPLVLTVMGGGDVCGPAWTPNGCLAARVMTPLALRRADLITSWSALMARVVQPYSRKGTPVEILHGGVELTRFHPGPKSNTLRAELRLPAESRVVFSSRLMRPLSNLHQIAAAAPMVFRNVPEAFFVFGYSSAAKDMEYEACVRRIAEESGSPERFRFIEQIPHEAMPDFFRLADVTIAIPDYDGTPMSALESMACGTPVVVGDIPDYDRAYFEPGSTVSTARVDDPESIAAAIVAIFQEPQAARQRAREAQRRVEDGGSFESQMQRMDRLYKTLKRV
ncbi:MAG: glycosyltransferase family 4 protein [Isosphaeraceae bacterium]|nr:glycosyltransferase family 4 protein [Isosphaeraceae bacterium]